MKNDMPLAAMVLLVFLVQVGGCSLFRRPVDEAAALREVHLELAGEPADSDAALVLKQALADAQELAPARRGDFLLASIERAYDARYFEIAGEAPLPEGWPAPSLPGLVRIKTYPTVRSAWARGDKGGPSGFMTLFGHITRRDIAMTAPVVMEYGLSNPSAGSVPERTGAMAFLYRRVGQDRPGQFGAVAVGDERPLTVLSVGMKGAYFEYRFRKAFARLYAWLAEHPEWRPSGMPRVLAYNSPFMPFWLKYSEVQIPVARPTSRDTSK